MELSECSCVCVASWGGAWKKTRCAAHEEENVLVSYVCSFISPHRLTPSTVSWRNQSWPRPRRRPSTFTPTMATQVTCLLARASVCFDWLKVEGYIFNNYCSHSLVLKSGFKMVTEFRQTEDWTLRCRCVIHKNIQEDPWNLPNSIKTLVESLQRFVDGMCTDTSNTEGIELWLLCSSWGFWIFCRWKEPAPPGFAQVHR